MHREWARRRLVTLSGFAMILAATAAFAATSDVAGPMGIGAALVIGGLAGTLHGFAAGNAWWRGTAGLLAIGLCTFQMAAFTFDRTLVEGGESLSTQVFIALVLMGWGHGLTALLAHVRPEVATETLAEDLAEGRLLEFEGSLEDLPRGLAKRAYPNRTSADEHRAPHRVAILPRTRLIVSLDRVPLHRLRQANSALVASPRCYALRVPLANAIFDDGASGIRKLCKRTLSADERDELHGHARRLRRPEPTWLLLGLGALGYCAWANTGSRWAPGLDLVFWLTLAFGAITVHARRWIAATRLDEDSRQRWVATVDETKRDATPATLEILPLSRVAWTEHGRPAPWRCVGD